MTKAERLQVEAAARKAINKKYHSNAVCSRESLSINGPIHEFDIFDVGRVIGGVSTSTFNTSNGNSNTGGRDRAAAELLWLSLWQGKEDRLHVLTCKDMATWLFNRFNGAKFPASIAVYHFNIEANQLTKVGCLSA